MQKSGQTYGDGTTDYDDGSGIPWLLVAAAAAAVLLFLVASPARAAEGAQQQGVDPLSLWPILLPLMAASLAIERMVEVFWNYVDWFLLNARNWQPAQIKSPQYVQFKSGTSLVIGVVLGILISNFTGMRLFEYLRPLVPNFLDSAPGAWDVIITGFIIGAGSKPIHDLIGMLTETKHLLGNSAIKQREIAGAAVADSMLKIAQSEAQLMIDVPGVGPARLFRLPARRIRNLWPIATPSRPPYSIWTTSVTEQLSSPVETGGRIPNRHSMNRTRRPARTVVAPQRGFAFSRMEQVWHRLIGRVGRPLYPGITLTTALRRANHATRPAAQTARTIDATIDTRSAT